MSDLSLQPWVAIAAGVLLVAICFGLAGSCRDEPAAVDSELVRLARESVATAREAHRQSDQAYLLPGRLRIVAICLTVAATLALVAIVAWLLLRRAPDDADVLLQVDWIRKRLGTPGSALEQQEHEGLPSTAPISTITQDDSGRDDD